MIPHPAKISRGGEDAAFNSARSLGVFDGVSAWMTEDKIDAGEFADRLSFWTQRSDLDPLESVQRALKETNLQGLRDSCVVKLGEHGDLSTFNMGDSGFLLFRLQDVVVARDSGSRVISPTWVLIDQSKPMMHSIEKNVPFQLASLPAPTSDKPETGDMRSVYVQSGDWVILATDGLFDNLTTDEITKLVGDCACSAAVAPKKLAWLLASEARNKWKQVDDITVVVGQITGDLLDD
jgi:protein phosphatase PTC7